MKIFGCKINFTNRHKLLEIKYLIISNKNVVNIVKEVRANANS